MTIEKALEKQEIYKTFNSIALSYNRINKILSWGIDKYWRNVVCSQIPKNKKLKILDLATGTGDQSFAILSKRPKVKIMGIDLAEKMLEIAKIKAKETLFLNRFKVSRASATDLPFKDSSYDMVTMSFGIRNVADTQKCFKEIYRVLRPSGKALILEFSLPTNWVIKTFYLGYLRYLLPTIGGLLSGNKAAYSYLKETIETFPSGDNFCLLLKNEGFKSVKFKSLSFGIVNLYIARKPL